MEGDDFMDAAQYEGIMQKMEELRRKYNIYPDLDKDEQGNI